MKLSKLLLGTLFFGAMVQANAAISSVSIEQHINHKIDTLFPTAHVGLVIQELEANQVIYAYQANKHFTSASTLKLFTSYAALNYLGADYRYQTTLAFDPKKISATGVLNSDVTLSFSGDPSFTDASLITLLSALKNQGVAKINGKFIIESNGFTSPYESPGATWDTWSYYPPVSSIIINENTASVKITPGEKINTPSSAQLYFAPDTLDFAPAKLTHAITTVSPEQAEQSCTLDVTVNKDNAIHLSGCWPINEQDSILSISLASPEKILSKKILAMLNKMSITYIHPKIEFNPENIAKNQTISISDAHCITTVSSAPLAELITPLLKDSNNLYADSLHKKLGEIYFGVGSYAYGVQAQQAVLTKLGVPFELNQASDGSGASRYNLFSPNQLVSLLTTLHQDTHTYALIHDALPVSGASGTLKNRFKTDSTLIAKNKIFAKTGSLKNISSLAGYIHTDSNKTYAFALMIQGEQLKMKKIKAKEDELLAEILRLL